MYHKFKKYLVSPFRRPCKICFPKFCCMLFRFISTLSRIIVTRTKKLLIAIRYLFFTMKKLFFETFGRNFDLFWRRDLEANFEVLLRVMFMVFFGEIFLICRFQRSFIYDVAGGTKFWPVLLMVVHGFLGKEFRFCDFHFMFFLHLVQFTLQL